MSKYKLTDSLIEYVGGGRIGTLKISYKDLQDKMDELERSGKVIVREIPGPSGDGKVNREFEVVDRDSAVAGGNKQERGFTVYDYKFGFDPGSQAEFMNEYPFSVGGNDLKLAMELIDGVEPYGLEEDLFDKAYVDAHGSSEDNVDNIDQVASPSAKGKGYSSAVGAERSESGKEQSDITQTTRPMYKEEKVPQLSELAGYTRKGEKEIDDKEESKFKGRAKGVGLGQLLKKVMDENGDSKDYTDEIAEDMYIDDDEFEMEMVMDRAKEIAPILKGIDMDVIVDFVKTHRQDIRGASDEEIRDEFEEFRSVNYDYIDEDLRKQFDRFK